MSDHRELARHGDSLRALARALLGADQEAEDVVHDAYLIALENRGPAAGGLAWLRGTVRNLARRRWRLRGPGSAALEGRSEPAGRGDPSHAAVLAETAARIAQAVHDLPPHQREVVVRRFWSDQPPRAIAAELGLEPKTVRNRLHLALARLRAELERDAGRPRRLRGLTLLALPQSAAGSAPIALPWTATLTAMQAKTVAGLALVPLIAALGWLATDGLRSDPVAPDLAQAPDPTIEVAPPARPDVDLIPGQGRRVAEAEGPAEAGERRRPESVGGSTDEPAGPPPTGGLALEVIHAETGAPVESFELRTLSSTRFLASHTGSPVSLRLSPGTYEGLILHKGADALALEPFVVERDRVTDLGRVAIEIGSASILGVVRGDNLNEGTPIRVELFGEGRNRCASCVPDEEAAEPCGACGYGPERSLVVSEVGDTFRFDRLAAGGYRLVVRDGERVILGLAEVILEAREERVVEIGLSFVDGDFLLTDIEGQPFDGVWSEAGTLYAGALNLHFWSDRICCAAATVDPVYPDLVQEEEEAPPVAFGSTNDLARAVSERLAEEFGVGGIGVAGGSSTWVIESGPADVERQTWHSLWPRLEIGRPQLQTRPLRVERLGPGLYRIYNLPAITDAVQLACGPFFSKQVRIPPLDLQSGKRIEVRLLQRCDADTESLMRMGPVNCTACHGLPDTLLPD